MSNKDEQTARIKKPALMAPQAFARLFKQLSKAALIDALWCAAQLGTNETAEQIATQAARNAVIALQYRGDRVPQDVGDQSLQTIDSD